MSPNTEAGRCTGHSDRETLLTCIRCERPFCRECMKHTEAGLICHQCLGLPSPEVQRRNMAIRQVLYVTGIGAIFGLLQLILWPFGLLFLLAMGILAGWLIGRHLRRSWGGDGRPNVLMLGVSGVVQGAILAAMVVVGLSELGILSHMSSSGGLTDTLGLMGQSIAYLAGAIAGLLWAVMRH